MTAIVTCDRCGDKYTLVGETHKVNSFLELVDVPFYTFHRSCLDPTAYPYYPRVFTLYKGKDYCTKCWQGYLDYKAKCESKEDADYMLEEKRKEEAAVKAEQEKKKWKEMQADKYLEHLNEVAPPVEVE